MLDNITKKNIDDCRDVLVGKVPDPKSQIEQITLALIYKFMDDMDQEAVVNFGGKAKFFAPPVYTGDKETDEKLIDYSKYSWRKLFDPSLSGAEMLALYMDALEKLNTNPNIPELFRNIFKNAYLPYRDPATLKLFLKYINAFEYSHSEKLGDAFEYLLSVMGSQGDAGQFRTPRNIIDFVTACVNPQKNETVLDPACGTAGFLLSAYKHIYLQNTKDNTAYNNIYAYNNLPNDKPIERLGTALTPDQRKQVLSNFVGYDISPDMVRLSLANMYLHGFTTPKIYEYDSLSSEDRWNENYDVILANPPFMTPKGGIRPHKKFGVQANKAEVLFTDYIAEHLNPNGRAGIVVPNGIVATSQTAYKQLRQHLVADSLIAVISLPAGCFNPYSGVKTSVLLLDKRLAKKSKHILFIKVSNDGFDLGAQRREHDKNDLPAALAIFEAYKQCLQAAPLQSIEEIQAAYDANTANPALQISTLASLVAKATVLVNKDVVLSGERYFEKEKVSTEYEMIKIGDVFKTSSGGTPLRNKTEYYEGGTIPWLKSGEVAQGYIHHSEEYITEDGLKNSSAKLFPINSVLVAMYGATAGQVGILKFEATTNQAICAIYPNENVVPEYLFWILKQQTKAFVELSTGGGQPNISQQIIKDFEIPLPPLEIQQQIVAEIDSYQKIIDGAKQVVNNYKPTININPNWVMVELGQLAKIKGGYAFKSDEFVDSGIQVLKISNVTTGSLVLNKNPAFIDYSMKEAYAKYLIKQGDILITMTGTEGKRDYGDVCFVKETGEFLLNQRVGKVEIKSELVNNDYLALAMTSPIYQDEIFKKATGVRQSNVSGSDLEEIKIPLPPKEEQKAIVQAIEQEMQLVAANKQLITLFEAKIAAKINSVWGSNTSTTTTQPKPYTTPETELSVAAEEG